MSLESVAEDPVLLPNLNPYFHQYEGHLHKYVRNYLGYFTLDRLQEAQKITDYETYSVTSPDGISFSDFLDVCQEHAFINARPLNKKHIIGLVHPFCFEYDLNFLDGVQLNEVEIYRQRLTQFFESVDEYKEHANVVLFETPHSYALRSNELMEAGTFDQVFFTRFNKGRLLDLHDIFQYGNRNWFLGGAYNFRCFSQTFGDIDYTRKYVSPRKRGSSFMMRDLVLNPSDPLDHESARITSMIDPIVLTLHENEGNLWEILDELVISTKQMAQIIKMSP